MSYLILDDAAKKRLVESGTLFLKAFHDANDNDPNGLESASRRGHLGGFRAAIKAIGGERGLAEIMDTIENRTGLWIPHKGPVHDDGTYTFAGGAAD